MRIIRLIVKLALTNKNIAPYRCNRMSLWVSKERIRFFIFNLEEK